MNLDEYKKAKKPHKYRAQKCEVDGIMFDSKREAGRFVHLRMMESIGSIQNLELQPEFDLLVQGGAKVGKYKSDFQYFDNATGKIVVEDVKGVRTPVYRLKKKIVEAVYNIKIVEV